MIIYNIRLLPQAVRDIDHLYNYIAEELMEPLTAKKYQEGILDTIERLIIAGGSIAINQREYIQIMYGPDARTTTYKKMTIVFNVVGDTVIIRRVIASSMVL
ncbi:hypothetical protein AGMMS4957_11300 [Bacteroidia bacterium]|nr:hypothetical protein AGMMS4957_11300 [Bacteroidia bacterium]